MSEDRYMSGREAAEELGVRMPTLYTYVSRGLIRSEPMEGKKRNRRYRAEDVRRLKERKEQRHDPNRATKGALRFGLPVLESSITLIEGGHLYYRGYDAVALSKRHTLEQVAELIWTGKLLEESELTVFGPTSYNLASSGQAGDEVLKGLAPIEAFGVALQLAGAEDPTAYDLRPAAVARTGARILRLLTTTAVGERSAGEGVAGALQRSWVPDRPQAKAAIDVALVLCVDHELNVSSFTARCVASAGATPHAVVLAGLSALSGVRHGGISKRVDTFLDEVGRGVDEGKNVRDVLSERLGRGEQIPGFGHPLYPQGDPRAKELLELATAVSPRPFPVELATTIVMEMSELFGEHPTLDFGLVVFSLALGLPPGGALALFALGRTVGWIGHAIEQYGSEELIRPRARYVGSPPVESVIR